MSCSTMAKSSASSRWAAASTGSSAGTPDGGSQTGQLFLHVRERLSAFEHVAAQRVSNGWNLVFNQRDERENQDINLNSISDIRLYIYYTDFTAVTP